MKSTKQNAEGNKVKKGKRESILKGLGVSEGIAIGQALFVDRSKVEIYPRCLVVSRDIDKEVQRFKKAIQKSKEQLMQIQKEVEDPALRKHLSILRTHITILEDKHLVNKTIKLIKKKHLNAEWALTLTLKEYVRAFDKLRDEYLRERRKDVEYVVERVLRNLTGKDQISIRDIDKPGVIVARDLSPADTAQMDKEKVLAFVTDVGGRTSHTAIMAKSLEIPAVVGLEKITETAVQGDTIIVDGTAGVVVVDPTEDTLNKFKEKRKEYERGEILIHKYARLPAETIDGFKVRILANIERLEELPAVCSYGAEGIGLYRTEFLFLGRTELPSEEEQYEAYVKAIKSCTPSPVTIRTLDIGGDKFYSSVPMAKEMNPAMGLRAIRFSLKEPSIFKTQLRAILRAGVHGNARIMFPMISGMGEVIQGKEILEETKEELRKQGIPFQEDIEIGIMIEIPSATVIADMLAKEVDFFSIGTNDLIQYSLAIDRVNEHVAYLYEPLHPAVLRTIREVISVAHREGINVAMCGEMAAELLYLPILIALKLDELSMNPTSVPKVKKIIRSLTLKKCKEILDNCLLLEEASEIQEYVQKELRNLFPEMAYSLSPDEETLRLHAP